MGKLSTGQLSLLGDSFLKMAQAVGEYRIENRAILTRKQNQEIREIHHTLLNYADDFYTTSAKLMIDDVAASLDRIRDITEKAKRTYNRLKNFQKAIDVAGAIVRIGAAILTKNLLAINEAIESFEKEIKK